MSTHLPIPTVGKGILCLTIGLAWNIAIADENIDHSGNPYASIAERNIFGLGSAVTSATTAPAAPSQKIIPNGIMTMFGSVQVLFKVTDPDSRQSEGQRSYILSKGQSEGGIEVTGVDLRNAAVTFNNHGTIQTLRLATGIASDGSPTANPTRYIGSHRLNPAFARMAGSADEAGSSDGRAGDSAAYAFQYRTQGNQAKQSNPDATATATEGSVDQNNSPHAGPVISMEEHAADEQMVMFAQQHMH